MEQTSIHPRYDDYKDSGVVWIGVIPSHWKILPFKALFQVSMEKNGKEIVGEMLSVSGYRGIEVKKYEYEEQKRSAKDLVDYRVVRPGQLVVNTMWLNYAGLGISGHEGHVSPAYRSYNVSDQLYGRYVHYLLRSQIYVEGYTEQMQGIRPNSLQIKNCDFNKFPVLVPEYDEQERIADFLDQKTAEIDEAIAKKQRLIELLKEQKTILINLAVTKGLNPDAPMRDSGVEWIGEIPEHWIISRIGFIGVVGNGSTPNRSVSGYWNNGTIPWLNSSKVNDGVITSAEQFVTARAVRECHLPMIPPGSVVVGITGEGKTRGMTALCDIEATINQHLAYIQVRESSITPRFLMAYLQGMYDWIRHDSSASGSTKGAITCGDIKKYKLPIPPIEEQNFIVDKIGELEKEVDEIVLKTYKTIEELINFKAVLISNAVTGKIKL